MRIPERFQFAAAIVMDERIREQHRRKRLRVTTMTNRKIPQEKVKIQNDNQTKNETRKKKLEWIDL
jgi:hypothetical protein